MIGKQSKEPIMSAEVKYRRMSQEEKELMYRLFEEKMELRKIARALGRSLSTVQYHLKKTARI